MNTILFVEDEHAFRAVFGEFLRNEGFTVLEASDMAEALHACAEYSGEVDLSIVETKTGTRLAKRLASRYPRMSVLFIGDADKTASGHRPPRLRHRYLQKPFSAEILRESVRGLIKPGIPV